ncbi:hypothetical protein ACFL96_09375 [Thermoproteota archaeon]
MPFLGYLWENLSVQEKESPVVLLEAGVALQEEGGVLQEAGIALQEIVLEELLETVLKAEEVLAETLAVAEVSLR